MDSAMTPQVQKQLAEWLCSEECGYGSSYSTEGFRIIKAQETEIIDYTKTNDLNCGAASYERILIGIPDSELKTCRERLAKEYQRKALVKYLRIATSPQLKGYWLAIAFSDNYATAKADEPDETQEACILRCAEVATRQEKES